MRSADRRSRRRIRITTRCGPPRRANFEAASTGRKPAELTRIDVTPASQKVTAFARIGSSPALAVGTTNSQLSLLGFPDLDDLFPPLNYDGEEIYDADFDDESDMVRLLFPPSLSIPSPRGKKRRSVD